MIEFIKQYWLQVIFGGIISALTFAVKHLFGLMKKERELQKEKAEAECREQELIKAGVIAILHDRIYQVCQYHIQNDYITIQDLDNLEYLYQGYSGLGGNGTGEELYKRCKALRLVSTDNLQGDES